MKRRAAGLAGSERRTEMTLRKSDYLLGVFDGHCMGALCFKEDLDGDSVYGCYFVLAGLTLSKYM